MQAATSQLFDALLRRAEIVPFFAPPKREFEDDDPRLFKNNPAFQLVVDETKRYLEACRPLTFRIAHTRAMEAAKLTARVNKAAIVTPSSDVVIGFAKEIERTTLIHLLKKNKALRSRYVAHFGAKQGARGAQ